MQCIIPSQNVRILVRGFHSLSRIGDELYVESAVDGLNFRTVNSAQSAYSSLTFHLAFFTHYKSDFTTEDGGRCKISMKSCLAVFKTPHCMDKNVDSCKIGIDTDGVKVSFQIRFVQGYTKHFFLSVSDNENIQLKYNKNEMCNKLSIQSKTLYGAIKHFRSNDEEITFCVDADTTRLKNYFENGEVANQKIVRTNLTLRPAEFEMYDITSPGSITFALRELRAVCTFSELFNSSPVGICFATAGKPVIFSVSNPTLYDADYVVSTLPPDMMSGDRPHRRSQLSDVVSSIPSDCNTAAKRQRLEAVAEESFEPAPSRIASRPSTSESSGKIPSQVSRPSLVEIIRRNEPQAVNDATAENCEMDRIRVENTVNDSPAAPNADALFEDDLNDECLQILCDQVDEMTRTQADKVQTVFRHCYSYSPDSTCDYDYGEKLCNASDVME